MFVSFILAQLVTAHCLSYAWLGDHLVSSRRKDEKSWEPLSRSPKPPGWNPVEKEKNNEAGLCPLRNEVLNVWLEMVSDKMSWTKRRRAPLGSVLEPKTRAGGRYGTSSPSSPPPASGLAQHLELSPLFGGPTTFPRTLQKLPGVRRCWLRGGL